MPVLQACITNGANPRHVAVGHVLDNAVVLAVGINYTRFGWLPSNLFVSTIDSTRMHSRTQSALAQYSSMTSTIPPHGYHLVCRRRRLRLANQKGGCGNLHSGRMVFSIRTNLVRAISYPRNAPSSGRLTVEDFADQNPQRACCTRHGAEGDSSRTIAFTQNVAPRNVNNGPDRNYSK
jgi:hypothetical protein